jgi:hypothetical protein
MDRCDGVLKLYGSLIHIVSVFVDVLYTNVYLLSLIPSHKCIAGAQLDRESVR